MAFVDALIKKSPVKVVIVDKHAQPGGHWNDAYPFVRLHQPSKFYGVNSRKLERSSDPLELASKNEILAYYEAVMKTFEASGQVEYFPMSVWEGSHKFTSLMSDKSYEVSRRAKIVNATYMNVEVPSVAHPLKTGRYQLEDGVKLVPLNDLTIQHGPAQRYVVIGAGKTGMDAVLWLLVNEVDPESIHWIMPRDSWIIARELFSPDFFDDVSKLMHILDTQLYAKTVSEFYERAQQAGLFHRLDSTIEPKQYKCATASAYELEQLRRVKNIVRLGRVVRLEREKVVLTEGTLATGEGTLHVDCSADGLQKLPAVPIFQGGLITLQSVSMCQQVLSAAFLGYLEGRGGSDDAKNKLATPVPHPDTVPDGVRAQFLTISNRMAWEKDGRAIRWLKNSRLYGLNDIKSAMSARQAIMFFLNNLRNLRKLASAEQDALENLQRLSKM